MKRVLIGGIGNVLLGDDGVGPYVVALLEQRYRFSEPVELVDLGTPGLDLIEYFAGADLVILIDAVTNGAEPGTITRYHRADVLRHAAPQRLDPHSPALSETLLAADMLGVAPANFLLIGISPQAMDSGAPLSAAVIEAAERVVNTVLAELVKAGVSAAPVVRSSSSRSSVFSGLSFITGYTDV